MRVCRAGLRHHPEYHSARVTLGRALVALGQLADAQRELESVLRVAPENIAARRELGEIYRRDGRLPEALEQLRSALALAPQDAELAASVEALARSAPLPEAGPERPPEPPAFQITTTSLETFPPVEAFPPAEEQPAVGPLSPIEEFPPVEAFTPPLEGSSDEPSGGGVKGARLLARLEGWLARIDADRQRRHAADIRG